MYALRTKARRQQRRSTRCLEREDSDAAHLANIVNSQLVSSSQTSVFFFVTIHQRHSTTIPTATALISMRWHALLNDRYCSRNRQIYRRSSKQKSAAFSNKYSPLKRAANLRGVNVTSDVFTLVLCVYTIGQQPPVFVNASTRQRL